MSVRIAFNALSVSNASGRHVLQGHVEQVLAALPGEVDAVLLHRRGDRAMADALGERLETVGVSDRAGSWLLRRLVERSEVPAILAARGIDVLFQPDGLLAAVPGVRQWVLAQNPWCFFPELHHTAAEHAKAWLQRRAYAQAQRGAEIMFFNSGHMAEAYEQAAGRAPRSSRLLHQGVADDVFARGEGARGFGERNAEILVVSAMAPHKNVEAVVRALAALRAAGAEVSLTLVGGWPDPAYRSRIEGDITAAGLEAHVEIVGHVDRAALVEHYARARVFCLLSRCESFGIPAVEAQACATPTVVARGTAAPEIAGPGGRVVDRDDDDGAAAALATLLTEGDAWAQASADARANAERFRWPACSAPLVDAIRDEARGRA